MALMVSEDIYDRVVRHGYPQIDPDSTFEMRVVKRKKRDLHAWVCFPEPVNEAETHHGEASSRQYPSIGSRFTCP
jgi:hypothetical protein